MRAYTSAGTDGGLDFQCIKVYEEAKLVCHLKNKGKYDIAYQYVRIISHTVCTYMLLYICTLYVLAWVVVGIIWPEILERRISGDFWLIETLVCYNYIHSL